MAVIAAICVLVAVVSWPTADRRRLRACVGRAPDVGANNRRLAAIGGGATGLVVLVVAAPGLGASLAAVVAVAGALVVALIVARLPQVDRRAEARAVSGQLPFLLEMTAAALGAGAPVLDAFRSALTAAPGPAAERLREPVRAVQCGEDVARAWSRWSADPVLGETARAVMRSAGSGAGLARELRRQAAQLRERRAAEAIAAARKLGVGVTLPLGLCFLPAFVAIGVVPLLVGLAGQVLPHV